MTLGKNTTTGRFNSDPSNVQGKFAAPRFVDNAVRHAVYSKQTTGFSVSSPVSDDFMTTHERKYKLIEEEDTVRLFHNPTDSHNFQGPIFNHSNQMNAKSPSIGNASALPPLLIDANDHRNRLSPDSLHNSEFFINSGSMDTYHNVDTGDKQTDPEASGSSGYTGVGTSFLLTNMKGRSLSDVGFTNKTVQIGQVIGVGLRSSDLAMRVVVANPNSLNSFITKEHSSTFIAQDFYGVDAISALRFIYKHDGYSARTDQYSNVQYVSQNRYNKSHYITENRTRGYIENQTNSVYNRAIVRGKARSNNDENVVQLDDFGHQEKVGSINEIPGGLSAPTAITKKSAKKIGQRALNMARKATDGIIVEGVQSSSHMHPGDALTYDSLSKTYKQIIVSSKHEMINKTSDLSINGVEASLEDIIQKFQEVDISGNYEANMDRNRQVTVEEFSTAFGFKVISKMKISERIEENIAVGTTLGINGKNIIRGSRLYRSSGNFVNNGSGYAIDYAPSAPVVGHKVKILSAGTGYSNAAPANTATNFITGAEYDTSTNIVEHAATSGINVGKPISGTSIPSSTVVESIISTTQFTLSKTPTGAVSGGTITVGAGSGLRLTTTTAGGKITSAVVHTAGSNYALNDVIKVDGGNGDARVIITSAIVIDDGTGSAGSALAAGTKVYLNNGTLLGTVAESTTTSITFDDGLYNKLINNNSLLVAATNDIPEKANSRYKIGAGLSKYLTNRRG